MAGRRRRGPVTPIDNPDRWQVSYADFVTLLFAFFIVMYSTESQVGGYETLSDSISSAFGKSPLARALPETTVGDPTADVDDPVSILQRELAQEAGKLVDQKLIKIERDGPKVTLSIKAELLFPRGSAVLLSKGVPLLEAFGDLLAPYPNQLEVSGFTDNELIDNGRFPSNWELSAIRAAKVVRELESAGVSGERMTVVANGENKPVNDNSTEERRAENRRIVLTVMAVPG